MLVIAIFIVMFLLIIVVNGLFDRLTYHELDAEYRELVKETEL